MTFSSFGGTFKIESNQTGADAAFTIADGANSNLMSVLLKGADLTKEARGNDAEITVSTDGDATNATFTSKTNSFTFDGTTIDISKLGELTTNDTPITVTTAKDHSAVKDLIVNFVNDYNDLISAIQKMVKTSRPKEGGMFFDPLTEEQEEEMTADQIEKWNEKAKIGLLFQDKHLNMLFADLNTAISAPYRFSTCTCGEKTACICGNAMSLHSLGIAAKDRSGILHIDEEKLEAMLATQGEKVAEFFTKANDGLAAKVNKAIDKAISTNSRTPGYLSSTSGIEGTTTDKKNFIHNQIQDLQNLIETLKRRYEDEMSRYWRKFTALETHMARMNSQAALFMPQMPMQ